MKINLTDLANLENEVTAVASVNANNAILEQAFDNTLSRDGTSPNQLNSIIDMNSNRMINLPTPGGQNDPIRKVDLDSAVLGHYSGQTINGTANEITASTVTVTTTLSLPVSLTFTGKTITGGTYVSPILTTPALGTPSSGVLTNCTGLPISTGVTGLGTGISTFLITPTSANLITAVTDETGTGSLVFSNAPTITKPNIIGTILADSAAVGSVGEYIESNILIGSAVSIVTGTAKTITSITLSAGDWDVSLLGYLLPAATTSLTRHLFSISSTTNTLDSTSGKFFDLSYNAVVSGGPSFSGVIPSWRSSSSTSVTLFLIAQANFTVSTAGAYGLIRARRVR